MHTIDVSPYLNLFGVDCRTDERCAIVAASTLKIVNLSICVTADESLGDIDLLSFVFCQYRVHLFLDIRWVWLRVLVSAHEVER